MLFDYGEDVRLNFDDEYQKNEYIDNIRYDW